MELPEWNCHDYMYSDPAWILQSAEDQQRFWLCLASLASQVVAAAFRPAGIIESAPAVP